MALLLLLIGVVLVFAGVLVGLDATPLGQPIDWPQYIGAILMSVAGIANILIAEKL